MTDSRIRVAVLEGGPSCEHEVSLISAANVMQYLDRSRFSVTPVRIERDGVWRTRRDGDADSAACLFNPSRAFDVVFPAVHGTGCEDGSLQGLLEQAGLPYVGCGVLASAIAMDKDVSKRLVSAVGIPVAPFVVFRQKTFDTDYARLMAYVSENMHFPLFVKPACTGSSVGIEKVMDSTHLMSALSNAFLYDSKVLVEQGINAAEIEVAVLESPDNGEPIVSVPGEIRPQPHHSFYSYAAKYLDKDGADLLVPADISDAAKAEIQALAKNIFVLLECEGMARIDFFLERGTGRVLFNELNTIPGFTSISMYPRLMAASGISYTELLTRLVDLALARHRQQKQRRTEHAEGRQLLAAETAEIQEI